MKRKRFYNNKKRGTKWTEEERGRKIDFADKYIAAGTYSDKFDEKRPKKQTSSFKKKEQKRNLLYGFVIFLVCAALVAAGYTGMDVYLLRHAVPVKQAMEETVTQADSMAEVSLRFASYKTESVSLDSSVMLSALMNDITADGYSAVTFDAKRDDGTVGYASSLASVDTFGAVSAPSSRPEKSIRELLSNDILPVARVCCYKDNVVPQQAKDAAVMNGKKVYKDSDGNTYLNPDSEMAYNYLRDMIQELSGYGVTVFVLSGCDLPEEMAEDYGDGFDALAKKLYSDIDGNIKLLEEVAVTVRGRDAESGKVTAAAIKKDIAAFPKLNENQMYSVTAGADSKRVLDGLKKAEVNCFTLDD